METKVQDLEVWVPMLTWMTYFPCSWEEAWEEVWEVWVAWEECLEDSFQAEEEEEAKDSNSEWVDIISQIVFSYS